MISYPEALRMVMERAGKLPSSRVSLAQAYGKVLAEEVLSPEEIPGFTRSAMDGYAVRAADVQRVPVTLKVIGLSKAGRVSGLFVRCKEAVKIMTGAVMPKGADSVVIVEHTRKLGKDKVEAAVAVKKGGNVSYKGEYAGKGDILLKAGQRISSIETALLAAIGRKRVQVFGSPKVGYISTGDELVEETRRPLQGQIRNSNESLIISLLKELSIKCSNFGIIQDKKERILAAVKKGIKNNDILLISGGVSVGDYDFVPRVLKELKAEIIFHKVRIKPGKPLLFARKGKTLIFGIPGNPLAALAVFHIFIKPAILKMRGDSSKESQFFKARLTQEFVKKPGRRNFVPANISYSKGEYLVKPANLRGSADLPAAAGTNGLMVVEEEVGRVKKGSVVEFVWY